MGVPGATNLLLAQKNTDLQIERSLRFNPGDSAFLGRTPSTASSLRTWTISFWYKRQPGNHCSLFEAATSGAQCTIFWMDAADNLYFQSLKTTVQFSLKTIQVFRDPSAWMHIVLAVDTTQAIASDRAKIYVNGSQITAFDSPSYPAQNYDTHVNDAITHGIGRRPFSGGDIPLSGYLAEVNFIDGHALGPASFGAANATTGSWQPKQYSGSYGSNGYRLTFADNSAATAAALGKDTSGNGNNWTPNNFSVATGTGNDSLKDSPVPAGTDTGIGGEVAGNYCTLSPVAKSSEAILSEGNLRISGATNNYNAALGTFALNSGKWYYEISILGLMAAPDIGWHKSEYLASDLYRFDSTARPNGFCVATNGSGNIVNSYREGVQTQISASGWSANTDVIGCAIDMDAKKIWFRRNGETWYPASTGGATGDPVAGTNPTISYSYSGLLVPRTCGYGSTYDAQANFGNRPFAYQAPAGFKCLVDANIPEPLIPNGRKEFNAVLYTGNSSARSITGFGFSPDLLWIKARSAAHDSGVLDTVRGAGKFFYSQLDTAEQSYPADNTSFDSDGFSLGTGTGTITNQSGTTYIAWGWNAGSTTASNASGSISSSVRANPASGFSIVAYTGNGSAGATVGHGLGAAPQMIIIKSRSAQSGWPVYHSSAGNTRFFYLENDGAASVNSTAWNNTSPSSSVFTLGSGTLMNTSGHNYVAYCFAPVSGYLSIGEYTGNGSNDGTFVYTGFRPAFVIRKMIETTGSWEITDAIRDPANAASLYLYADIGLAESSFVNMDLLSNGFKSRTTATGLNSSGSRYLYMAFAESPFKYARAR